MGLVGRLAAGMALITLIALGSAAQAHHTYVTKYDPSRKMSLTGVITAVRYFNPHIFFDIRVESARGGGAVWKVETESIPKARAKGLTKARLEIGARVTVTGWPARNGTPQLGLGSVRLPGGKRITIRTTPR